MDVRNSFRACALVAALLVSPTALAEHIDGDIGHVEVRVEGISSTKGTVYASIFLSSDGFPGDKSKAYAYRAVPAKDGTVILVFEEVPAGEFVVAVLHDADSNEELSFNFLGMPKEDYGFSRDARAKFGPPKYEKAAVSLEPGEIKTLTVKVKKT